MTCSRPSDGSQEQLVDYHKIMANLYLRKQHMDEAVSELKKALVSRNEWSSPTSAPNATTNWPSGLVAADDVAAGIPMSPSPGATAKSDTDQDDQNSRLPAVPYQGIASPFETV